MRSRCVKIVCENGGLILLRVKPVLVGPNGMDPFGPEIVAQYEEVLLKSEAEGVKIRALLFCKSEFRVYLRPQSLTSTL